MKEVFRLPRVEQAFCRLLDIPWEAVENHYPLRGPDGILIDIYRSDRDGQLKIGFLGKKFRGRWEHLTLLDYYVLRRGAWAAPTCYWKPIGVRIWALRALVETRFLKTGPRQCPVVSPREPLDYQNYVNGFELRWQLQRWLPEANGLLYADKYAAAWAGIFVPDGVKHPLAKIRRFRERALRRGDIRFVADSTNLYEPGDGTRITDLTARRKRFQTEEDTDAGLEDFRQSLRPSMPPSRQMIYQERPPLKPAVYPDPTEPLDLLSMRRVMRRTVWVGEAPIYRNMTSEDVALFEKAGRVLQQAAMMRKSGPLRGSVSSGKSSRDERR